MHPSHVVRNGSKSTEWMATVAASSVVAAALTQWLVRIAKWDSARALMSSLGLATRRRGRRPQLHAGYARCNVHACLTLNG